MVNTATHNDSIARTGKPAGANATSLEAQIARLEIELAAAKAREGTEATAAAPTGLPTGTVVSIPNHPERYTIDADARPVKLTDGWFQCVTSVAGRPDLHKL